MKLTIGLVGYSCAGKGTFYEFVREKYIIPRISTGDLLRQEVARRGLDLTPTNIAKVSDQIREETDNKFMQIAEEALNASFSSSEVVLIDSVRQSEDLEVLKQYCHDLTTIAIVSSQEQRYKRMTSRTRQGDPITWEEFLLLNQKEKSLGIDNLINDANYRVSNY